MGFRIFPLSSPRQSEVLYHSYIKLPPFYNVRVIKKFHLHRRMAEVEVEFMGRKTVIHLGIEMVEKREKKE